MELDLSNYTYETRYPRTLNECINDLVQGHAGVVLPYELEKNFLELVDNEILFRYPLIRYMYAHILLKGYWTHESDFYNSDKEAAMYLLQPMAEAGLPAAQFDIGYYFYYSEACAIEKHLYAEKAKWILKACKQNYPPAIEYINYFLHLDVREKLPTPIIKEVCEEIVRVREDKNFALELLERMKNKI